MLSDAARQKKNEYQREYYRRNKDKERQRVNEYWERKAAAEKEQGKNES